MRKIELYFLSIFLSILPSFAPAKQVNRRRAHSSRSRIHARRTAGARSVTSIALSSQPTHNKIDGSAESLRERWVDLLGRRSNNIVRSQTEEEIQFYYSAELLADKLLGLEDEDDQLKSSLLRKSVSSDKATVTDEISMVWKSVALGSSGLLIGFPIAVFLATFLSPSSIASFASSIVSSVSSFLPDLSSTIPTSISVVQSSVIPYVQSSLLQAQTVFKSLRHVQVVPLLIKIIRKCIILEAWRHIWIRLYKLSRFIWKGTLKNVARVYYRVFPAWIRRGVKNMFQSMVQAQVHGVMGSVAGSMMSGITFESWAWRSSSDSSLFESEGIGEDIVGSVESTIQEAVPVEDIVSNSMSDSAAHSFQSTMQDALDSTIDQSCLESAVEAAAEDAIATALSDSVESSFDSAMDSVSDVVETVVDDVLSDSVEASFDSAIDSLVEDALPECVECVLDGALDS
mmetsp:Transcript_29879/g.62873  ORF Transcript_29879/g.62873 Transcript_29879/m.62873 type:complete len:457 (-) Transcript_29879:142-1512(-)